MQYKKTIILLIVLTLWTLGSQAQYSKQDSTFYRCFVGSTAALIGNFAQVNKPEFAQLNFGYRISAKDALSIELKTWKYAWPLGIPYGPSFENSKEAYPGYIREKGFAFVYQRFLWKGFYTGIHVMSAWQRFVNRKGQYIDKGFQLFNTYRAGYHIKLFKDRFFIEPSIAITHRPYQTEMPNGFKELNNKWSRFFFGEPGLHFGFNF